MKELLKVCSKCKQEKTRSCFSNRTNSPDGKQRYCKACASESSLKCMVERRAKESGLSVEEYRKALEQKRNEQHHEKLYFKKPVKRNMNKVNPEMFTTRNRRAALAMKAGVS
jgi:hypothetical protein